MYVTQILDFANSQILQNLLPIGFNFNWDLIGKGSMEAQYGRVVSSKVVSVVVCHFYFIPFKMKPDPYSRTASWVLCDRCLGAW